MRRVTKLLLTAVTFSLFFVTTVVVAQEKSPRRRESFDLNWRFSLTADSAATQNSYNDAAWRLLNVPHDWSIEGAFDEHAASGVGGGALPGGIGWYRKKFNVPGSDRDKKIFIDFDGVYWNSDVWINGHHVGHRPNGYISFRYELTPFLNYDKENVVAVKVDNSRQPNSRWYSGSGIYRHVWLVTTNKIFVDQWGTSITTPDVSKEVATIAVETRLKNHLSSSAVVSLRTEIYDNDKRLVGSRESSITLLTQAHTENQSITIQRPELWSVETPVQYTALTVVTKDKKVIDSYETKFGIRTFEFDPYKGFSLNGKPLKILGVCNHHDLGCLGTAINERALERQLEILRGMGVNGIRTSHNPPAPELLDLCDKMGFLVMDESFDMWKKQKTEYDYSHYWDQWHEIDLRDFVMRDRNHPSVIIWSVGNEIGEQWDPSGEAITKELVSIVKNLDSTRPVTTANNEVTPANSLIKSGALDIIGFNYHHEVYADFHKNYPGKKFIATETTSALETRGHYDMPSDSIRRWPISWDKVFTQGNTDNTVSAYDNVSAPWGSTHEETWKVMKKHPHLSGMFIWTGFDYIGEPTPYVWPSRSSYFGVVDLAGFPKDVYYMYKSEWTKEPVLHLFPHWSWTPGQTIDLWAYYNNADEVELFVNGVSQGVRKKRDDDLHVMWRVKFAPGTVKVVSRKDGTEVLMREIKTASAPTKIEISADRKKIKADNKDLTYITLRILDKDGNVVPHADNRLTFEISGPGTIAGVDNGDPTSHDSFKAHNVKIFNGLALCIVQSTAVPGTVKIKATSPGLQEAVIAVITTR